MVFTNGEKELSTTHDHDFRSPDQLKSLFRDQQWLLTRRAQEDGSYQGYLADLIEAWKTADTQTRQQIHNGQSPTVFADCIRFALIHTTIVGNLGDSYHLSSAYRDADEPSANTIFLSSLWPDEATDDSSRISLETISNIADLRKRVEALIQLAEHAADEELEAIVRAAVETLLTIQEGYWEFPRHLWEPLYPYLLGASFARYAHLIFASANESARACFIRFAMPKLRGKLIKAALDSAFSIHDPLARTFTLREFIHRGRGKQQARILQQMYRTVSRIDDPLWKSTILVELVGKLTGEQRTYIIHQAMMTTPLVPGTSRGWDANSLMPYLSRVQRIRFLNKMLSVADPVSRIETCLTLWYYLPKKIRQQAISMALKIRDLPEQAIYLARIAQNLHAPDAYQEAIQHIVKAIGGIRNEDYRTSAISDVQKYVQDEAIEQVANLPVKRLTPNIETLLGYRFAFAERDRQHIAYALGNLSAFMSDGLKAQAQPLMVDLALEIDLDDYVAEAIEGIAPYLDAEHLGKALEGALQIGNGWSRVWALSGLAPYLTGEPLNLCLHDALDAAGLLMEEHHGTSWFDIDMAARLLPSLKGPIRDEVLSKGLASAAKTSERTHYDPRIRFLPYLEGEAQIELSVATLHDVPKLPNEDAQSSTLTGIAPYLPAQLIAHAIEIARTIQDDYDREYALSTLISHMPDIQVALALAQTIESPFLQSSALVGLLLRLSGESYAKTLQLAMEVTEKVKAPGYRLRRWLDFFPLVEDQPLIQRKIIETMLDYLWAEKDHRRNNILVLCEDRQCISEKTLPADVLKAMGDHVMQICMEWKW